MDEYKQEIGKITAPFSYQTAARALSMQLNFPDGMTRGHLQFVFNYKDGASAESELFNISIQH